MGNETKWAEELAILKAIVRRTELEETLKWGTEVYTYRGKNVLSFAGFKHYFALWFYNGAFLKDEHNVLINAQEGVTRALRQWRFTSKDEINETLILDYIAEAIENEKEGKRIKPRPSVSVPIPEIFKQKLDSDKTLMTAFKKLTPYKQNEYNEYIQSAKREETKESRIQKIIPLILKGAGLNDKYKNC